VESECGQEKDEGITIVKMELGPRREQGHEGGGNRVAVNSDKRRFERKKKGMGMEKINGMKDGVV